MSRHAQLPPRPCCRGKGDRFIFYVTLLYWFRLYAELLSLCLNNRGQTTVLRFDLITQTKKNEDRFIFPLSAITGFAFTVTFGTTAKNNLPQERNHYFRQYISNVKVRN